MSSGTDRQPADLRAGAVAAQDDHVLPVLHVDMDAFYVEVERQRDPSLIGVPVVVGGASDRGVIASASYEARMRGVRSAMPSARARQLCPDARFISADFANYHAASEAVHSVFASITPLIEPIALDEAFLDVSGAQRLFGSSEEIAWRIRHDVSDLVGLDCSVGVGSSKLIAKLASVAAKPRATPTAIEPGRGVLVVPKAEELAFLHAHPVRALWGVGAKTFARLDALGVKTVGDLTRVPLDSLTASLGNAHGRHLAGLAAGIDDRPVEPEREAKSIGHEETFERDVTDRDELKRHVVRLADAVAGRLRRSGTAGRTVQLKIRRPDLRLLTRSITMPEPVDTAPGIVAPALDLLWGLGTVLDDGVRLLGVSVSGLGEPGPQQLSLDVGSGDDPGVDPAWNEVSSALDQIRDRFGERSIGPGSRGLTPGRRPFGP